MEIVNTLDIDGTQWEITDNQARQDIINLKSSTERSFIGTISLNLKPGFTATSANISYFHKFGKLYFGSFSIVNLNGDGMGTEAVIDFAEIPITLWHSVQFTLTDVNKNYSVLGTIDTKRNVKIYSTNRLEKGINSFTGFVMFFEA